MKKNYQIMFFGFTELVIVLSIIAIVVLIATFFIAKNFTDYDKIEQSQISEQQRI
ncbi:hypothetical protein AAEX28_03325 [Lentisphaerota bacterium WC36G]|nr:hypothetical protein LJT99_06200 [Lentisphaerae bacterium WC36]